MTIKDHKEVLKYQELYEILDALYPLDSKEVINEAILRKVRSIAYGIFGVRSDSFYSTYELTKSQIRIKDFILECKRLEKQIKKLKVKEHNYIKPMVMEELYQRFVPYPWNNLVNKLPKDAIGLLSKTKLSKKIIDFINTNSISIIDLSKKVSMHFIIFNSENDYNYFMLIYGNPKTMEKVKISDYIKPIDKLFKEIYGK